MLSELLVILLLVLINGVFAGAEIAILSIRKTRLAELIEAGNSSARAVARLREHPEAFLATVQIGITVVGATAAAFGGASVAAELAPVLAAIPPIAPFAEKVALGMVVVGVSFLSLVLGELVPKSLALRAGEPYALTIAQPLSALAWAGRPFVAILTGASNIVLRLFGDRTNFTESRLSREEVQQIVEEATTAGSVDAHAGEIASRALGFSSLDAYTLMVPRAAMVCLAKTATAQEIAQIARHSGHARVPIFDGNTDNFIGFLNLREALAAATIASAEAPFDLQTLLHPIPFVPDLMPAPTLLRKLQEDRAHLALVSDEQGTVVGLVTIEDLLEELVGDILSENDRSESSVTREGDGAWLVEGNTPLHTLSRTTGYDFPNGEFSTIAGLVLHIAGVIPSAGWHGVAENNIRIEVVEATQRRVKRVRVRIGTP